VTAETQDIDPEPAGPPEREVPMSLTIGSLSVIHRRVFSERLRGEPWIAAAGLRPGCYAVLSSIGALQPTSQAQVSADRNLDPSDVVGIVDILERAGFVIRDRDTADRRKYSLTLTPEGETALERLNVIAAQVQDAIFDPLNARDRATFERLLRRLVQRHAELDRTAKKS
jgi:DNA-binding MarR family transcriptional regulator